MSKENWRVSPILGVADVRAAAEYYRDVLGFELDPVDGVFQPSDDEPGGVYGIVKRGGVWIHLQIRRGDEPRREPQCEPQRERQGFERDVYVYVDDVAAVHDDLKRRGANIVRPPAMAPYGIRELDVVDLNGYRLTFGEMS